MLNKSTSRSKYVVQSGDAPYPVGFEFFFNGDGTPQVRVTVGTEILTFNRHYKFSAGALILMPTEEEAADPNWLDKWVGMELVIERDVPFVQESDYQVGRISSEQIEKDFDLSVMRDQMLADKISEHTDDVQGEIDALHSRIEFVQEEHALDMFAVDNALAAKASKTELENAKTMLNVGIQGNAQAIQKTRDDYQAADQEIRADMNSKDSELEAILNDHTERLDTLRTDIDDLGDDVSGIQAKIPQSASGANPLITKQQLLDEEMDIREDLNGGLSELQTQVTSQAAAIATKAEKDSVYTKEQVDAKVSSVYKVKGSVANYDSLPTGANVGDVYDTLDSGANYVWTESGWDKLGDIVDLTDYAKKDELSNYLPTAGGEVDGDIRFNGGGVSFASDATGLLRARVTWGPGGIEIQTGDFLTQRYYLSGTGFYSSSRTPLGISSVPWVMAYIQKLNNGADIAVPTTGGTMALKEDIDAAVGDISTALTAILGE